MDNNKIFCKMELYKELIFKELDIFNIQMELNKKYMVMDYELNNFQMEE